MKQHKDFECSEHGSELEIARTLGFGGGREGGNFLLFPV